MCLETITKKKLADWVLYRPAEPAKANRPSGKCRETGQPTQRGMQEKRPGRHPTERGMQEKRPGCQPTERGYARDMRGICASHTLEPSIIVDSELKQGPPRFPGPHQSACFCSAIVSKHILGHENIYCFIFSQALNLILPRTCLHPLKEPQK